MVRDLFAIAVCVAAMHGTASAAISKRAARPVLCKNELRQLSFDRQGYGEPAKGPHHRSEYFTSAIRSNRSPRRSRKESPRVIRACPNSSSRPIRSTICSRSCGRCNERRRPRPWASACASVGRRHRCPPRTNGCRAIRATRQRRISAHKSAPTPTRPGWIRFDAQLPVSLYLHVPFCEALCSYCGCHTTVANRSDRIDHYAQLLMREVELVSEAIGRRQTVSHIHWGGGTPTALAPDDFVSISHHIARRFRVAADAEIAVEIDPRPSRSNVTSDAFAETGINRASLGRAGSQPGRAARDRTHPELRADRARGAATAGYRCRAGQLRSDVRPAASIGAIRGPVGGDGVDAKPFAGVPVRLCPRPVDEEASGTDPVRRFAGSVPSGSRRFALRRQNLGRCGYIAIGLDHFARADDPLAVAQSSHRLHRNFQGYTTDDAPALIGLGASSIGCLAARVCAELPEPESFIARRSNAGSSRPARGFQALGRRQASARNHRALDVRPDR